MSDDNKAGAAAVLGGIAAIIAAFAGLYGAFHKPDPTIGITPSPIVITTANQQYNRTSPQTLANQPRPRPHSLPETPHPTPRASESAPVPPPTVPFDIEGIWSGRPESWQEGGFELHLSAEVSKYDNQVDLTGQVVEKCTGVQQVRTVGKIPEKNYWRPGLNQLHIAAEDTNASSRSRWFIDQDIAWGFNLKRKGDILIGTFYDISRDHAGSDVLIEFHQSKLICITR